MNTMEKAINKADGNGWELPHEAYDFAVVRDGMIKFTSIDDETQDPGDWYMPVECIIFDHSFAKALWGEDRVVGHTVINRIGKEIEVWTPAWQYHLQQLAIAEDRMEYLKNTLEEL